MKSKIGSLILFAMIGLTGCAELSNLAETAKDSAISRAKMEASAKASEATGKILGSKY
ncbi:hypothetical protein ACFFHT_08425 [Gallibacterium melopsittaci]|uniref:Lipoprotein n=1 Tax=Gallibacterium melopsittaci TaxID=516063 RepID=A0ABV6HXI6_9PAST